MGDIGDEKQSSLSQARLTAPRNITPNTPVPLVIDIQDTAGKAIKNFDTFQEKLMHLIVVSDDLQFSVIFIPLTKIVGVLKSKLIFQTQAATHFSVTTSRHRLENKFQS